MEGLQAVGGPEVIARRIAAGRPVLAICVGHQVLFAEGVEHGRRADGCGVWPGLVEELRAERLRMGWNTVDPPADTLFAGVAAEQFYFVHSYGVRGWRPLQAHDHLAEHGGDRFVAAVRRARSHRPSFTRRSPATPAPS
jgi:glutamine amidotransferase